MACTRVLQWLMICSVAGWAGCGSAATAPRPVIAHADSQGASAEPQRAAEAMHPAEPQRAAVPPHADEPPGAPAAAALPTTPPPTVEPAAPPPPCPSDRTRDEHQKPDHVVQLVELSQSMTVVDL